MQEVARLEAQLEAADLKPKSKLSQRPKDTVVRDQTNSLSNMNAQRMKSVEPKQLSQVTQLLKLFLQQKQLATDQVSSIAQLLFGEQDVSPEAELTIGQLRAQFEELGVSNKKST